MMSEQRRCGARIEVEWPGHRAVLSRRYCRAWPLRGYEHCVHHLTFAEHKRRYLDPVSVPVSPP